MHGPVHNAHFVTLFQMQLVAKDDIAVENDWRNTAGRLEAESLLNHVVKVFQIEARVDSDAVLKLLFKRFL